MRCSWHAKDTCGCVRSLASSERGLVGEVRKSCSLSVALLVVLTACKTIDPAPFVAFSTSVQTLQSSMSTSLTTTLAPMEQRYVSEVTTASAEEFLASASPLKLSVAKSEAEQGNGDAFSWSPSAGSAEPAQPLPLFLQAERFRMGMDALNASLVKYAQLLVQLTSSDLITKEQFSQLSADLNTNTVSALTAITGGSPDPGAVALFSTVAGEAARQFIESRRRDDLLAALTANQPVIDGLGAQGQKAARYLAYARSNDYQDDAQSLLRGALAADGEDARRAQVEALISLDRAHMDAMETLRAVSDAYGAVPAAHRDLLGGVKSGEVTLSSIEALYVDAKRLDGLYSNSRVANQARADQATADALQARAAALVSEAEAARKKAKKVRAAAQSEADPQAKARLSEQATKLEGRAKKLEAAAEVANQAATVAIAKAAESNAAAVHAAPASGTGSSAK